MSTNTDTESIDKKQDLAIDALQYQRVLLNPEWFYRHEYTPIVSYLKNNVFIKECTEFKDAEQNNILHYLWMGCRRVERMTVLITKWCVKMGIDFNVCNSKKVTPFYYYTNFLFEVGFGLQGKDCFTHYFKDLFILWDGKSRHSNGNNILHIISCFPFKEQHFSFVKGIIQVLPSCLQERNTNGQSPLCLAMSTWRKKETLSLLLYMYLKTPGATLYGLDNKGRNLFHLACEYGIKSIVSHMLKVEAKIVSTKIKDENETPVIFRVVQNMHVDLLNYLIREHAQLLLERDGNGKDIFTWIFECYTLERHAVYKQIYLSLLKRHLRDGQQPDKQALQIFKKFAGFEKYGNYQCFICLETKDPRHWEAPVCCKNHPEKFHSSCLRKWLQVSRTCPMCDFKENTDSPHLMSEGEQNI